MTLEELEAKVKVLENKVRTLEDIEEIEKLQKIYGYYLEHWQADEIVGLYSDGPDTYFETADSGVFIGKESIRRFFTSFENPPPQFIHVMMQLCGVIHVDPDGKTAKGRWYGFGCLAIPIDGVARPILSNGVYENEYVKENGKWKFKKIHWNRIFLTPYEDGWVKTPVLTGVAQYFTKPDRPTSVYEPYPSGYMVPFHYKNPVSGR